MRIVTISQSNAGKNEKIMNTRHFTEVCFASLFSSGFTTMAVMNPPEKNLEKRTSVQCMWVRQFYMGPFKYYVIMFLTFLGPPTHLFDDLQYSVQ